MAGYSKTCNADESRVAPSNTESGVRVTCGRSAWRFMSCTQLRPRYEISLEIASHRVLEGGLGALS